MNILSVERCHILRGKDINDWCVDQIRFKRSHAKEAIRLTKKHYDDDAMYQAYYDLDDKNRLNFRRVKR